MRDVPIRNVVDARASQGRVILHLACGHNAFVGAEDVEPEEVEGLGMAPGFPRTITVWPCVRCPAITEDEVREAKSPQQLYREEGEP